ncbi:hypothetical protein BH10BDE1_BH10BDE1_00340 [soil metagenome]
MFSYFRLLTLATLVAATLSGSLFVSVALAKDDNEAAIAGRIEKIAVFPLLYKGERGERVDEATAKALDETWWQVRDELTVTGRFVVASRAFLQKADAFQPRGALSVGDAVILGRYVEADALLTISLENRTLTIEVYSAADGTIAWRQSVDLHPSVLIREQVAKVARALIREFVASLPYQATTLQDRLAKKAVFTEGGKRSARIKTANAKVEVGDAVEWIQISRINLDPLFQGGQKLTVIGEGVVREIQDQVAVAELGRVAELGQIRIGTLVNLPKEKARLLALAKPKDSATSAAVVSLLASGGTGASIEPEAKQAERKNDDSGPMATTLSILSSLAVILLLAF